MVTSSLLASSLIMSAIQVSPIPLDVCFIIIDMVANDDGSGDSIIGTKYATLRACALTCQDWLEKSRAQLYGSVVLQRRDDFECFTETVASSSYLGSLVRSLRCELEGLMDTGDIDQSPLPAHITRCLVGLKSLTVVSNIIPSSTSFIEFLRSFSICGTLDSLYIRGGHFVTFEHLAGVILSFAGIKSLQIRQCGWHSRGSVNWSAYAPFTRLTNAKVRSPRLHAGTAPADVLACSFTCRRTWTPCTPS